MRTPLRSPSFVEIAIHRAGIWCTNGSSISPRRHGAHHADLLIGADGYKSSVRAFIDPKHHDALYSGYMLWRGMCREDEMPATRWPDGYVDAQTTQRYRLVAYAVPGPDGALTPGHRQISWAWYDPDRRAFLQERNCIAGDRVIGTRTGDRFGRALRAFERERLEDDRQLVLAGHAWGQRYLRDAAKS